MNEGHLPSDLFLPPLALYKTYKFISLQGKTRVAGGFIKMGKCVSLRQIIYSKALCQLETKRATKAFLSILIKSHFTAGQRFTKGVYDPLSLRLLLSYREVRQKEINSVPEH